VVRPASGFRLPVVSSRQLTPTTHAIEVEKPQAFMFGPTQFTFRQLLTEAGMDVRPMSLATSPTRSHLEYTVRLSDSPYITSWLRECRSLTSVIFVLDDYQLIDSCVQTLAGHRAFAALSPRTKWLVFGPIGRGVPRLPIVKEARDVFHRRREHLPAIPMAGSHRHCWESARANLDSHAAHRRISGPQAKNRPNV
jgi:hypothetical protein